MLSFPWMCIKYHFFMLITYLTLPWRKYCQIADNRDFLQVSLGCTWRAIAACSIPKNTQSSPFMFASTLLWSLWFRNYLHTFRQSGLRSDAFGKQLTSHCSMILCIHARGYVFLTIFLHFITYWWLLWKNWVQIVKQFWFPSSTFEKHLTSDSGRTERDFVLIFFPTVIQ